MCCSVLQCITVCCICVLNRTTKKCERVHARTARRNTRTFLYTHANTRLHCARTHTHTQAHTNTHTNTHTHTHTNIRKHIHVHIDTRTHTHTRTHKHFHTHTHTHVHVHTHEHTQEHTNTHTHTHTHTHPYSSSHSHSHSHLHLQFFAIYLTHTHPRTHTNIPHKHLVRFAAIQKVDHAFFTPPLHRANRQQRKHHQHTKSLPQHPRGRWRRCTQNCLQISDFQIRQNQKS